MGAPCSKCIKIVCEFGCKCECHDPLQKKNPDCIRCGNTGVFKVKYRNPPKGLVKFVQAWVCIDCRDEFK